MLRQDSTAALIEEIGLGPAHVAGLSWGGTLVLELYRHHPELVATLILVDTYAGWKGSLPEEEVRARVEGVGRVLAAPPEEFAEGDVLVVIGKSEDIAKLEEAGTA